MIKQELGNKIREVRKAKGFSQESFSRISGIDRTYIASVEAGRRNISLENIEKIAKSLNISLTELFSFTSKRKEHILITINGINFLLQSSEPLSAEIKEEIELIIKYAFDDEESSLLAVSEEQTVDSLYDKSAYDIILLIIKAIKNELDVSLFFEPLDNELKLNY